MSINIIELSGNEHTRGRTFGAARHKQIQAYMLDWLNSLRTAGIVDPHAYIARMLRDTDFLAAIHEHSPDLLEEVEGISVGAGQPTDLLLASQFMDEEWAFRAEFQSATAAIEKCSSVAIISRGGPTWIGQNMDLGSWTDGHQVLLQIGPNERERGALIFTIGGMIGLLGVNARKVAVCVNSLPQLPSAREGLPVAFMIRKLLQADSLAAAVHVVCSVPHATGQHYLFADPITIRSFEASPAGVIEYHSADPTRILHTNHPLVDANQGVHSVRNQANSVARLKSLTSRLMMGNPGFEEIKAALSSSDDPDHPVCRMSPTAQPSSNIGTTSFTTGSMISALLQGPQPVDSWVSAGPPSMSAYKHVRLSGVG